MESVDESVAFGAPADEAATHDVAGAESAGAGASSDTAAATLPICALIGVAAHVAVGNGPVAAAVDTLEMAVGAAASDAAPLSAPRPPAAAAAAAAAAFSADAAESCAAAGV